MSSYTPENASFAFCPHCGERLPTNGRFCPFCGGPLSTEAPQEARDEEFNTELESEYTAAYSTSRQYSSPYQDHVTIENNYYTTGENLYESPKSRMAAFLFCLFLGVIGAHRFYVGKIGTGILWLLTFGLLGFGALIDLIVILCGGFKDKNGLTVKNW